MYFDASSVQFPATIYGNFAHYFSADPPVHHHAHYCPTVCPTVVDHCADLIPSPLYPWEDGYFDFEWELLDSASSYSAPPSSIAIELPLCDAHSCALCNHSTTSESPSEDGHLSIKTTTAVSPILDNIQLDSFVVARSPSLLEGVPKFDSGLLDNISGKVRHFSNSLTFVDKPISNHFVNVFGDFWPESGPPWVNFLCPKSMLPYANSIGLDSKLKCFPRAKRKKKKSFRGLHDSGGGSGVSCCFYAFRNFCDNIYFCISRSFACCARIILYCIVSL
jgi:hypothetical protein